MYRPSMYNKHDESMYTFAELFNNCKVCNDVIMKPNDEETYGNDGYFIHSAGLLLPGSVLRAGAAEPGDS